MAISAVKAKVWLFHFKHSRLRTNIVREICSYFADPQLAQVTSTFLRFFFASAWGPQVLLSTPIHADSGSAWVMLEDKRLFCSGGSSAQVGNSSSAYLLGRNGAVEELPSMLTARRSHGVIQVLHVYIFGGSKL